MQKKNKTVLFCLYLFKYDYKMSVINLATINIVNNKLLITYLLLILSYVPIGT